MNSIRDDIELDLLRTKFNGCVISSKVQEDMIHYARFHLKWSHQKAVAAVRRITAECQRGRYN